MNLAQQKQQLRQQMRTRRRALSVTQQRIASRSLCWRLAKHPLFIHAKNIALYLANDGEISPWPLLQIGRFKHKRIFLPVIQANGTMIFRQFTDKRHMQKNRFNILEPSATNPGIKLEQLDIICLPLVAFDQRGNRLGMGGGYYDRTLAFKHHQPYRGPKLIGLAHAMQEYTPLATEYWDVPLNAIATEKRIYRF